MLEIRDLHVSYGNVKAVRGVSAVAVPGRVTLVLGANGAGKSTTLRAVAGLQPVASGKCSSTANRSPAVRRIGSWPAVSRCSRRADGCSLR